MSMPLPFDIGVAAGLIIPAWLNGIDTWETCEVARTAVHLKRWLADWRKQKGDIEAIFVCFRTAWCEYAEKEVLQEDCNKRWVGW